MLDDNNVDDDGGDDAQSRKHFGVFRYTQSTHMSSCGEGGNDDEAFRHDGYGSLG